MKHFQLTSDAFEGAVDFYFNENNLLAKFDTQDANLSVDQAAWILNNMPRELSEVQKVLGKSKTARLTEIKQNITFEMFWDRYDDKMLSSKKRTEAKWNRMSSAKQVKAFNYIATYFALLPQNTRKKFAETYLSSEIYMNAQK